MDFDEDDGIILLHYLIAICSIWCNKSLKYSTKIKMAVS